MVRVIKTQLPAQYTTATKSVLDLVAVFIVDHQQQVRRLLASYGIQVAPSSNGKQLTHQVLWAIETKGKSFHRALAKELYQHMGRPTSTEDSFNVGAMLSGQGTSTPERENSGITIGADPVSAIAGAVGSIASLFGNKQKKKLLKMQANSHTLQTMLAYKAQQSANQAAKEAAIAKQANQKKLLKMTGTGLVIAAEVGFSSPK